MIGTRATATTLGVMFYRAGNDLEGSRLRICHLHRLDGAQTAWTCILEVLEDLFLGSMYNRQGSTIHLRVFVLRPGITPFRHMCRIKPIIMLFWTILGYFPRV